MQVAVLGASTSITLFVVERAGCLDVLPSTSTIVCDLRVHGWLHLHATHAPTAHHGGHQPVGNEHTLQHKVFC